MLTAFPQCNFSADFQEIIIQNLICYYRLSVIGNSKTMHSGILYNMPNKVEHVNEYPTMHYFGIPRHSQ